MIAIFKEQPKILLKKHHIISAYPHSLANLESNIFHTQIFGIKKHNCPLYKNHNINDRDTALMKLYLAGKQDNHM